MILEEVIRATLIETGIITFIVPTILFMAIVYVFLQRSKLVESKTIALTIAFFSSLLILAFPAITGMDMSIFLSTFFAHLFVIVIVFFIGIIAASIFYADFTKILERFAHRSMISVMIIIALITFVSSGLLTFIISTLGGPETSSTSTSSSSISSSINSTPPEITFTIGTLVLLIVFAVIIFAASYVLRRES